MKYTTSASALAFTLFASNVLSQDCPAGTNRTIEWADCASPTKTDDDGNVSVGSARLQCGILEVPLDWQNIDTRTLRIPLVRIPALNNPLDQSIIVNPGGPGASGVDTVAFGGDDLQA